MTLEERAEQIAADLQPEKAQGVGIDPMTIMLILGILIEVVKLFMKCHSASGAVAQLADPGWFHRLLMRRIIKKRTNRSVFHRRSEEVEAAIIGNAKSVSTDEMEGYYTKAKYFPD